MAMGSYLNNDDLALGLLLGSLPTTANVPGKESIGVGTMMEAGTQMSAVPKVVGRRGREGRRRRGRMAEFGCCRSGSGGTSAFWRPCVIV